MQRTLAESTARWLLGAVTLLLMASIGGGFLALPLLIPAHIWAARRSRGLGRVGWSVLPAVSVAMAIWAAVYVSGGERTPTIWLGPLLAFVGAFGAAHRIASPRAHAN
jgi:hypothetical protein